MKKYINGKLYNTDTATKVGIYSNDGSWRDFGHVIETLYRKRTGEYFLHGEGGPATKYRERVDCNCWSGGEKIIPMLVADARKWAEENLDADEYEAEFGASSEDESSTVLSVSMPSATADKARRAAAEQGVSLSAYIAALINRN